LPERKQKDGRYLEMKHNYNFENSGHKDSFEIGNEFQDFVCIELAKEGIILQNINSKKFQYEKGENLQGFEIKYDSRSTGCNTDKPPTNRISIEIAEKTDANNESFVDSGIYRGDNSWLYIIGNYMNFWIFGIEHLRAMHRTGKYQEREMPTIRSFYIPLEDADKYCIKKYVFEH
jgi:hypothetical protein